MKIVVTGAAGFIGSSFVRIALKSGYQVLGLDALTYAGHIENIEQLRSDKNFTFTEGNICDPAFLTKTYSQFQPDAFINFAAESHVDNSILGPQIFLETNVVGVFQCLTAAREYFEQLIPERKKLFRFLQVSTDEVFGSLGKTGKFTETTPYQPNSPYSSTKAAGDHLTRAWFHTYGLPTIITNCSNNYGPRQFPEKLIPVMVLNAASGRPLPVYGKGDNIRDWIHVEDHSQGVLLALEKGNPGQSYCFGGNSERTNLDVTKQICKTLDKLIPLSKGSYSELISFVEDRKGHDFRYAIDDSKAITELGFSRTYKTFEDGLEQTIKWYLENKSWINAVTSKKQKSLSKTALKGS